MATLKDIAGSISSKYGTGTTKVWYQKPDFFQDGCMGFDWLQKKDKIPTLANLEETHVLVGTVDTEDNEEVFMMMQGESWSPKGQANLFIFGLGLRHTSISVGDIVQRGDTLFLVDGCGFKVLP